MRRCSTCLVALVVLCSGAVAQASMVVTDNIVDITRRADLVVRATCASVTTGFAGKQLSGAIKVAGVTPRVKTVKHYTFTIDEVLVNKTTRGWSKGEKFDVTQFQGFTLRSGRVKRPSVRLPSFDADKEYILFMAVKDGRWYSIGVDQGVFTVQDDVVFNSYMKVATFKGIETKTPSISKALSAGKISISAPPPSMDIQDFQAMVKDIARSQGGAR